ncbi:hypothetical protein J6590_051994 [Homalodisca vitripennis]|nr:hypothetical protein J6590_051994 [Homalodisca vitripennis]
MEGYMICKAHYTLRDALVRSEGQWMVPASPPMPTERRLHQSILGILFQSHEPAFHIQTGWPMVCFARVGISSAPCATRHVLQQNLGVHARSLRNKGRELKLSSLVTYKSTQNISRKPWSSDLELLMAILLLAFTALVWHNTLISMLSVRRTRDQWLGGGWYESDGRRYFGHVNHNIPCRRSVGAVTSYRRQPHFPGSTVQSLDTGVCPDRLRKGSSWVMRGDNLSLWRCDWLLRLLHQSILEIPFQDETAIHIQLGWPMDCTARVGISVAPSRVWFSKTGQYIEYPISVKALQQS